MHILRKNFKNHSDEELVQLLGGRDSSAVLSELHLRYAKRMLGFFKKMTNGDLPMAQDLTHELFIKILDKHHLFDSKRKFFTWMYVIASNMAKTHLKRNKIESEVEEGDAQYWIKNDFDRSTFRKALQTAIYRLEDHHKEAFILRYIQELNIKDIAEITNVSEGTVKSRLFYATKKMSTYLAAFKPDKDGVSFKLK